MHVLSMTRGQAKSTMLNVKAFVKDIQEDICLFKYVFVYVFKRARQ